MHLRGMDTEAQRCPGHTARAGPSRLAPEDACLSEPLWLSHPVSIDGTVGTQSGTGLPG